MTPRPGAASGPNRAEIVRRPASSRSNRSGSGGSGIPNASCSPFVPAGADAQDEPAAGHVVEHGCGLREERRMPERGRRDRHAEPSAGNAVRERRECRERLERNAASLLAGVREVVAHPAGVEDVELAGTSPHRVERRPVQAGGAGGRDTEADRPGTAALIAHRRRIARPAVGRRDHRALPSSRCFASAPSSFASMICSARPSSGQRRSTTSLGGEWTMTSCCCARGTAIGPNVSLDRVRSTLQVPPRIHLDLYAEDQPQRSSA